MLLDEIEKAHHEVFNVLLQLLDDGRLTDGQGRTVDFTNVVLIMTSNLPGDPAAFFRPEFLNRIDEIVRFRSLTEADIERIVVIQLRHLRDRLAKRRLSLEVSDEAAAWLARTGYDPVYGARPLKRVIQRHIADPLALALLEGRYAEGDTVHGRRGRRRAGPEVSARPTRRDGPAMETPPWPGACSGWPGRGERGAGVVHRGRRAGQPHQREGRHPADAGRPAPSPRRMLLDHGAERPG